MPPANAFKGGAASVSGRTKRLTHRIGELGRVLPVVGLAVVTTGRVSGVVDWLCTAE